MNSCRQRGKISQALHSYLKQVLHRSRPAAGLCGSLDVSLGEPAAELWCDTPLAVR